MEQTKPVQIARPLPPLSRVAYTLANAIYGWEVRRKTRRKLSHLDEHLLHDIGLSRTQAEDECNKPFWRP